jgi:hypothetical protein
MARKARPKSQSIATIAAAISGRRRRARHSKLFLWMREHFAELQADRSSGRADWVTAAEEFRKLGLTDRDGKPPSAQTARMTWSRVVREEEAERERATHSPKPSASEPAIKPATKPAARAAESTDDDEPDRPTFTPVRNRK